MAYYHAKGIVDLFLSKADEMQKIFNSQADLDTRYSLLFTIYLPTMYDTGLMPSDPNKVRAEQTTDKKLACHELMTIINGRARQLRLATSWADDASKLRTEED